MKTFNIFSPLKLVNIFSSQTYLNTKGNHESDIKSKF